MLVLGNKFKSQYFWQIPILINIDLIIGIVMHPLKPAKKQHLRNILDDS